MSFRLLRLLLSLINVGAIGRLLLLLLMLVVHEMIYRFLWDLHQFWHIGWCLKLRSLVSRKWFERFVFGSNCQGRW